MEIPLLSIRETKRALSVGKTTIYQLVKDQKLCLVKVRGRSLITVDSIEALIRDAQTDGGE